ncbi:hypothetical protein BDW_10210 [Bdellovibrio bacteriovorus W]|nr:hypothetical protein BDW_10210 [Bdellovibrio bacteriovorus W]
MALKKGTSLITTADKKVLLKLGRTIKEVRESKGLSVYDVTGEDMPIKSRQHWQKIEAGQLSLTFVTFLKITKTLNQSPSSILENL